MRLFQFNLRKAVQAIGVLLHTLKRDRLEYLSLMKMLYIADREALIEADRPITGDDGVASKNDPVSSGEYDQVKLEEFAPDFWVEHLCQEDDDLVLKADPGTERLSRFELKKLQEIAIRYASKGWREMVAIVHDLPEYKRNDPRPQGLHLVAIPLDRILEEVGRIQDADSIKGVARESIDSGATSVSH